LKLEISDDQGERSKKQEENESKTPTFRRHRESGAPEKSKASSEFNGWATPGFINIYYLGQTVPAHLQT